MKKYGLIKSISSSFEKERNEMREMRALKRNRDEMKLRF